MFADAPAFLTRLTDPWSQLYSDSKVLETFVTFLHVAPLLLAGGLAVTLDRATLRAWRGSSDVRGRHLDDLGAAHRVVLAGLALSLLSGVLLFAADVDTFWSSWIWWTKAGLIVILLANGWLMTRAEAAVRADPAASDPSWDRLRTSALVSIALWFAITLAGVALVNV